MDDLFVATEEQWSPSKRNKLFAWGTHFFTASGVIWGFLAILAITRHDWLAAFVWMAAATFVDSFDGLLAGTRASKKWYRSLTAPCWTT